MLEWALGLVNIGIPSMEQNSRFVLSPSITALSQNGMNQEPGGAVLK